MKYGLKKTKLQAASNDIFTLYVMLLRQIAF